MRGSNENWRNEFDGFDMRILAAALFLVLSTFGAQAACEVPPVEPSAGIHYFLNIQPSDGILDVWCRLQTLQGQYKVNVYFERIKAHRSFEVAFDGTPSHDRIELASFIQSLLPTAGGQKAIDENGMNFSLALERVVQGAAAQTPDNQDLGIPTQFDGSKSVAFWEKVALRIKPVTIGGIEFTLTVNFRPAVGRLMMALNGQAEDLVLRGWHEFVLREAGPGRENCPKNVPDCKDLGDVIDLHTAWVVESVLLEAYGSGLSATAMAILGQIEAENDEWITSSNMKRFEPTTGEASIDASDKSREVRARADGDPKRTAGTQAIRILWNEVPKSRLTYTFALQDYARQIRESMVLQSATQKE